MKHALPIAIVVIAAAAAITGVVSFKTGVFQTASVGELIHFVKSDSITPTTPKTGSVNNPGTVILSESAPGSSSYECSLTTQPWIRILSPNGNELYTKGHRVTVTWASCNISASDKVHVSLIWKDSKNGSGGLVADATNNDNQEIITLPSNIGTNKFYKAGNLYKVQVVQSVHGSPNYNGAVDTSDNYFSII